MFRLRNVALWVIVVLLMLALFTLFQNPNPPTTAQDIAYSQFITEVDQGRVRRVTIQGQEINGAFTDGRGFQTYAPNDPTLTQRLINKGVTVTARPQQNDVPWWISLIISWLPFLLFLGVVIHFARSVKLATSAVSEVAALKRQIEDCKQEIELLKSGSKPPA